MCYELVHFISALSNQRYVATSFFEGERMKSLALAAAMSVVLAAPLAACSCSNGGPRNAAAMSRQVYLGRVLAFGASRRGDTFPRSARLLVTLPVKGAKTADTATVWFYAEGNSCAAGFVLGLEYLVYAIPDREGGTRLVTDSCAGTKSVNCAGYDLQTLGIVAPRRARDCRPARPSSKSRPAT